MEKRRAIEQKREDFRSLHETGCFVIPNPWDAGSAVILESVGFKALASSSAGFAWTQAKPDNAAALDDVLRHLSDLVEAVDVPINADFEDAFAQNPSEVAINVKRALETGIAGLSVEDSPRGNEPGLYDFDHAVERVAAARSAIDAAGGGVILTGRSEGYLVGQPDFDETIKRLQAYSDAGADCLYAPGLRDEDEIATVVKTFAPKPVNVLTLGLPLAALAELGARRVSVGGSLARNAYAGLWHAAKDIAETGNFASSKPNPRGDPPLNKLFAKPN